VLPTISDCTFERVTEVGIHAFEAFARPCASYFIAGLNVGDARTMPRAPLIPIIGHVRSPTEVEISGRDGREYGRQRQIFQRRAE
jgi:hypothetical protein